MLPTPKMKLLWLPMAAAMVTATLATVSMATDADPSGASVNIINGLNDTMVCHCWSGDDDFGQEAIFSRSNYYWKFDPNIGGNTRFTCTFLWKDKRQEFPVWEGSRYSDRLGCCSRGPCVYKVSYDGIWNANFGAADGSSLAEEWVLYKPWVPNPAPQ